MDFGMIRINAPATGVDYCVPFGGEKASSYSRASRAAPPSTSTRKPGPSSSVDEDRVGIDSSEVSW
jgi:hypothetical protein